MRAEADVFFSLAIHQADLLHALAAHPGHAEHASWLPTSHPAALLSLFAAALVAGLAFVASRQHRS